MANGIVRVVFLGAGVSFYILFLLQQHPGKSLRSCQKRQVILLASGMFQTVQTNPVHWDAWPSVCSKEWKEKQRLLWSNFPALNPAIRFYSFFIEWSECNRKSKAEREQLAKCTGKGNCKRRQGQLDAKWPFFALGRKWMINVNKCVLLQSQGQVPTTPAKTGEAL